MLDHCIKNPHNDDFEMRPPGQPNNEVVAGFVVKWDRETWNHRYDLSANCDDHRIIIAGDKEFVVSSARQDQVHNLLMFELQGCPHLGKLPSAWFEVVRRNLKHGDTVRFRGKTDPRTVEMVRLENDQIVAYLRGQNEGEREGPFPVADFELLK